MNDIVSTRNTRPCAAAFATGTGFGAFCTDGSAAVTGEDSEVFLRAGTLLSLAAEIRLDCTHDLRAVTDQKSMRKFASTTLGDLSELRNTRKYFTGWFIDGGRSRFTA